MKKMAFLAAVIGSLSLSACVTSGSSSSGLGGLFGNRQVAPQFDRETVARSTSKLMDRGVPAEVVEPGLQYLAEALSANSVTEHRVGPFIIEAHAAPYRHSEFFCREGKLKVFLGLDVVTTRSVYCDASGIWRDLNREPEVSGRFDKAKVAAAVKVIAASTANPTPWLAQEKIAPAEQQPQAAKKAPAKKQSPKAKSSATTGKPTGEAVDLGAELSR
jgi:hypothetical protein